MIRSAWKRAVATVESFLDIEALKTILNLF